MQHALMRFSMVSLSTFLLELALKVVTRLIVYVLERTLHQFNEAPEKPVPVNTGPLRSATLALSSFTRLLLRLSKSSRLFYNRRKVDVDGGNTVSDKDPS